MPNYSELIKEYLYEHNDIYGHVQRIMGNYPGKQIMSGAKILSWDVYTGKGVIKGSLI